MEDSNSERIKMWEDSLTIGWVFLWQIWSMLQSEFYSMGGESGPP